MILRVAGLRLSLRPNGERGGVERGVSSGPEERAVRLVGLEIAEVTEAASSAATAAAAASTSAETSSTSAEAPSAEAAASRAFAAGSTA